MCARLLLNGEGSGDSLTVDCLTRAIINSYDRAGMPEAQAKHMARHVLNFFGYSDRIIDNVLEPEDRDAFYMLEDSGLLTTEREETTLYDGREWRIHYWLLRRNKISQLVDSITDQPEEESEVANIYDDIPDDFWDMRNTEE